MPVPIGLNAPHAFAFPIKPSITVPDLTTVTAVSFSVLFPDQTTTATWTGSIPATVPSGTRGFESLVGNANPSPSLLIAVHVFATADDPQIGTYLVKPIMTVTGAAGPVYGYARPLVVTGPYGQ